MERIFSIPEDLGLSEKEQKGLGALAKHLNEQLQEYLKGYATEEHTLSKMQENLKSWAEENGVSAEKLKKMEESLKSQGSTLQAIKERANYRPNVTGLKAAFDRDFDSLAKAIKEKRAGYSIKAVNEHTDGDIQTTANSITSDGDVILTDSVKYVDGTFFKRRGRQYIEDIANVTRVDSVPETLIFDEEGDEKGAIGIVAENAVKTQSHLSLVRNQVNAKKAAGYIVVTEELMKWRNRVWAQILRLFQDKVGRDYEDKLTEDMLTNASAYTSTPLDGTIANPTDFDALIAAMLQIETLNFRPDVLVINPADKWRLAMTQTNNGMFVLPYIQNGGQFGLLGLRVVVTTNVEAGTFIVGEGGTWFIEREPEQLRTGYVNDDFIHNRMSIVGEIFFLSYVPSNNAGSFVKATFSDVKEALKAA